MSLIRSGISSSTVGQPTSGHLRLSRDSPERLDTDRAQSSVEPLNVRFRDGVGYQIHIIKTSSGKRRFFEHLVLVKNYEVHLVIMRAYRFSVVKLLVEHHQVLYFHPVLLKEPSVQSSTRADLFSVDSNRNKKVLMLRGRWHCLLVLSFAREFYTE